MQWLLAAGAPPPLIEAFGGYFPEYGIFTEEFIPGENVLKQVKRIEQVEPRRLRTVWPFIAWSSFAAHAGFWDRTGRRLALREPSPAAFIVPSHDYQTGARLVSLSDRSPCVTFEAMLDRFLASFVEAVEAGYPELRGKAPVGLLLSAAVEPLGLERARALVEELAREGGRHAAAAAGWLARLQAEGYTPRAAHFAAARYLRWIAVNPLATVEARGRMLGELWGTYRLGDLEADWPDTRIRFFRKTVFEDGRDLMTSALDRLMARARAVPPGGLDLEEQVAAIRAAVRPSDQEDYFLARLTYRHLRPTDEASLITLPSGDHYVTEVVMALEDQEGERYFIRAPASPREVARLLQMFQESNLDVTFSAEHQFLMALDSKDTVVGGLFYRIASPERAQMEKVVVSRKRRGTGLANGLMHELVRRLRARGVRAIEVGYYRPEFFERFGFRTEPSSGGLVLDVVAASALPW